MGMALDRLAATSNISVRFLKRCWATLIGKVLIVITVISACVVSSTPAAFASEFGVAPNMDRCALGVEPGPVFCVRPASGRFPRKESISSDRSRNRWDTHCGYCVLAGRIGELGILSFLLLRAFGAWNLIGALVIQCAVEPIPERNNIILLTQDGQET